MAYFSYHATAKRLIAEGKLRSFRIVEEYHGISPALLLLFDDPKHPVMPIREERFPEYLPILTHPKKGVTLQQSAQAESTTQAHNTQQRQQDH